MLVIPAGHAALSLPCFYSNAFHQRDTCCWMRAGALKYQLKLTTTTRAPWYQRTLSTPGPGLTRHEEIVMGCIETAEAI